MGLIKWQYTSLLYAFFILPTISIGFAADGFEYLPDESTLGLWHFDGGDIVDTSANKVKGEVEGKAAWDANQDWNKENKPGKSFVFDGNTVISLGEADVLIPKVEITIEAWVYPEDLTGWRLIFTNWDGPPGAYHLGVQSGITKFHINTDKGTAFAGATDALELEQWQHVAGTYDSNQIKLYIDGKEVGSTNHGGKLAGAAGFDVIIGSKNTRQFKWKGLIDEVRISDIAREADVLSPNLDAPQAVEYSEFTLPTVWGSLKNE
ncbi:hypothetical protein C6499_08715 [Candidatus Poribacteria bacterium]|nr:MAG: hypothetical protein C6499_08715 [Candidatus Poribacteria bacterium]